MADNRGRPETTQLLRTKLGFHDDMLWKSFCARRLELIHSLSLSTRKASEQEEPVQFVARKLCQEYGYDNRAQHDFEKLVRAGIQSVRRNQRRFTRSGHRDLSSIQRSASPLGGTMRTIRAPGAISGIGKAHPSTLPSDNGPVTGIVAALQGLKRLMHPLAISQPPSTPATKLIRDGIIELSVGLATLGTGYDSIATQLCESCDGELGNTIKETLNIGPLETMPPLLANAAVYHGPDVAFAMRSVFAELLSAAGPNIDEMIQMLKKVGPIELPKSASHSPPQSNSSLGPDSLHQGSYGPKDESSMTTPESTPVPAPPSNILGPSAGGYSSGHSLAASSLAALSGKPAESQSAQGTQAHGTVLPGISGLANGVHGSSMPMAPAPTAQIPPYQPSSQQAHPQMTSGHPQASLHSTPGQDHATPGHSLPPVASQPHMQPMAFQPMGGPVHQPAHQPTHQPAPHQPQVVMPAAPIVAGQQAAAAFMASPGQVADRRVTIHYGDRRLDLVYSPLKNTPPTLAEIIEHSRKTFTIPTDSVIRVRDLVRKRILDTDAELLEAFYLLHVDLELFLPPPMLHRLNLLGPRFAPVAPIIEYPRGTGAPI